MKHTYLTALLVVVMAVVESVSAGSPAQMVNVCDDVTEIPDTECAALVALYNSTGGTNWSNRRGWTTNPTPCSWYGVSCDNGHLLTLNLVHNGLKGSLPPEIGDLNLKNLDLSANQLSGSLPSKIGNLNRLEWLDLGNNELTSIPTEIGALASLWWLDLHNNEIAGPIPTELGNLTRLQRLFLAGNRITGGIPAELGNLVSLTLLNLAYNELTGSIPPEVGNLAALNVLDLSGNQLTSGISPQLANLTELYILDLADNSLTGSIPIWIGDISGLGELWLARNQFTGGIPSEFSKFTRLRYLDLSSNSLTGSIPAGLGGLTKLTLLRLTGNPFTGSIPMSFTTLTRLSEFRYGATGLCAPAHEEFQAWLTGIPDLSSSGITCSPVGTEETETVLNDFFLESAYPNPFTEHTTLRFGADAHVPLEILLYNTRGVMVHVLYRGMLTPGHKQMLTLDGGSLPSGTYLVRMLGEGMMVTRSVVLVK